LDVRRHGKARTYLNADVGQETLLQTPCRFLAKTGDHGTESDRL
jgi:hypothetical protein